jgi:hypothetical protein
MRVLFALISILLYLSVSILLFVVAFAPPAGAQPLGLVPAGVSGEIVTGDAAAARFRGAEDLTEFK